MAVDSSVRSRGAPAGRGDDDARGAGLQIGNGLLADLLRDADLVGPSCVICALPGSSRLKSVVACRSLSGRGLLLNEQSHQMTKGDK